MLNKLPLIFIFIIGAMALFCFKLQSEIYTLSLENAKQRNEIIVLTMQEHVAQENLTQCNLNLHEQNEQIKTLYVEQNKLNNIIKNTQNSLKNVALPKNSSCENKLKFYENLFIELSK